MYVYSVLLFAYGMHVQNMHENHAYGKHVSHARKYHASYTMCHMLNNTLYITLLTETSPVSQYRRRVAGLMWAQPSGARWKYRYARFLLSFRINIHCRLHDMSQLGDQMLKVQERCSAPWLGCYNVYP